ncbi:Flavanone 3-dioxygenase protein [Dioscorea alata]|uniref:Flavanone 3-dioxygenase protein n=1 Tax=Dioscorea alata TaxID=55571 RepID=A0ACB7UK51_DIOAL|nr:Flavanone 3-dioxygenase protein [Dioscorea alata]
MGFQIDPSFNQATEHRPKSTISDAGGIPLIDLSPLLHDQIPSDPSDPAIADELSNLIAQIGEACKNWGFFQVVNHGVAMELLERVEAVAREFFALPAEEKRKVKKREVNPMGYYDAEHTKNVRDWREVFDFTVTELETELLRLENQWPENPPEMRKACEEYVEDVKKLAYKLLELIAMSLNLPAKRLNEFFEDSISYTRLNHYNPCPSPDLVLSLGRHKDGGVVTILFQDEVGRLDGRHKDGGVVTILFQDEVGRLDVKRKVDGEWVGQTSSRFFYR